MKDKTELKIVHKKGMTKKEKEPRTRKQKLIEMVLKYTKSF